VLRSLEREIFPFLGPLPIPEIDAPLVLAALRNIENRGSLETAKRVRQRISAVFVQAISEGICSTDPAAIVAKALRPAPKKARQPAIADIVKLRELLASVESSGASRSRRSHPACSRLRRCGRERSAVPCGRSSKGSTARLLVPRKPPTPSGAFPRRA
jgi:hypothetical protein